MHDLHHAAAHLSQALHHDPDHGWLHSVETGAAVDGPGIRFVYFLSGCLFRCVYCHNPDTWKLHNGRRLSLDEAVAEAARYAGFLRAAGGVTVSGGEPLMQAPFVGRLLRRLKDEHGLHTALDTQGFLHAEVEDDWFDAVDLVLLDIKHSDPDRYHLLTGQELQPTLDCARRLADLGKAMWIRYVLVPGWSDDTADIARLANFVASLGPVVQRVEVLPFHQMGAHKWQQLGLPYPLADTPVPTLETTEACRQQFRDRGIYTL
ncbi:pyruvate formate-lyase-activating protein [Caenispirillum bisanense]|uniref:pyruvate formate-lyase-activating protein n=1 Tax=Caenispirillum bisanense TaxID=414052 RepID=UPI0031DC9711